MRLFKRILFLFLALVIIAAFYNYPKLNIISGYASKVFLLQIETLTTLQDMITICH